MLGDQIIPDERGKVIGVRVLPPEGRGPRIELTFQTTGTILGVKFANTGTVTSETRPSGILHAEGQGVALTEDGQPIVWTFHGLGKPSGPGLAARFTGSVRFETPAPRLAALNHTCAVVEAETDAEQRMTAKLWAWTEAPA